jgi:hypothetical protein
VFHRQPLPPLPPLDLSTRSLRQPTLAEFLVKKFLTPEAAEKVLPVARDYVDILQDLQNWIDKRQMNYPVDTCAVHPTLNPRSARVMVKKKFEEDHFWHPSHDPTPPSVPRTMGARRSYEVKCGRSTYQDFFDPDARCGAEPILSAPIVPSAPRRPFGTFPLVTRDPYPVSEVVTRQFGHNNELGRANKEIFEAETCL